MQRIDVRARAAGTRAGPHSRAVEIYGTYEGVAIRPGSHDRSHCGCAGLL